MFSKKIKLFVFGFVILLGSASVRAADIGNERVAPVACSSCEAREARGGQIFFPIGKEDLRGLFDSKRCVTCATQKHAFYRILKRGARDLRSIGSSKMLLRPRK